MKIRISNRLKLCTRYHGIRKEQLPKPQFQLFAANSDILFSESQKLHPPMTVGTADAMRIIYPPYNKSHYLPSSIQGY